MDAQHFAGLVILQYQFLAFVAGEHLGTDAVEQIIIELHPLADLKDLFIGLENDLGKLAEPVGIPHKDSLLSIRIGYAAIDDISITNVIGIIKIDVLP